MNNSETKQCQNCKNEFIIEPEDFEFYEKIKVPSPTFCASCRLQRKAVFRNGRLLYKNKDAFSGKELISIFPPDSPVKVIHYKTWWGDSWDAMEYGQDYNWNKSFFEQWHNLLKKVPFPNVSNINTVNSEYCHSLLNCKDCYLTFIADDSENSMYSINVIGKDISDCAFAIKIENCYQIIDSFNSYRVFFSQYANECIDSVFLLHCRGSSNCFSCVNLRKKQYYIFNKKYSKKEYENKIKEFDLGSYKNLQKYKKEFQKFILKFPHSFAEIQKSRNSIGNNITNSNKCYNCFDSVDVENSKYIKEAYLKVRDCLDVVSVEMSELVYDSISIIGSRNLFCKRIWEGIDCQYSYNCYNSQNLFGCIGLRNKQYCILNKQYTKEEYEKLVPRIIKHMNDMPYISRQSQISNLKSQNHNLNLKAEEPSKPKEIIYKYGEFFPPELSPFAYNETVAQEYFPLTKEQAIEKGYQWREPEERNYQIDIKSEDLLDHIKDVNDDIVNKVIQCAHYDIDKKQTICNEQCVTAFKIIPRELEFYRKQNIPLPRLCPNCRHYQRIKQRNPLKLWHRKCQCAGETSDQQPTTNHRYQNTAEHPHHKQEHCPVEFETSYAPERPEIVYCEKCYQQETI